jgi:hypothetical protein
MHRTERLACSLPPPTLAAEAFGHSLMPCRAGTTQGGMFLMGSDAGFFPEDQEGPTWKVKLSPFRIGKYEVSNKRFKKFVKATGCVV